MTDIHGFANKGFEQVRETFENNFKTLGDLGASYCVTKDGETVVDLWGGFADETKSRPWERRRPSLEPPYFFVPFRN